MGLAAHDVPKLRVRALNGFPPRGDGRWVVYWMVSARRLRYNFALDRAVGWASELKRPLVILEALRAGYRWASDRHHTFLLEGMLDNARDARHARVAYFPYVEPSAGDGKGLLEALARDACVVVTDDYPAFFIPGMQTRVAESVSVLMEAIDSNGLLPLAVTDRAYPSAYTFRRFLQRNILAHLSDTPRPDPLKNLTLPRASGLRTRLGPWAGSFTRVVRTRRPDTSCLPIDHAVPPVSERGGRVAAEATLEGFLRERLARYARLRNQPEEDAVSRLSPYLHFGHISVHAVFARALLQRGWRPDLVRSKADGTRGWWGADENTEAWLDQLITWRELGFNFCRHRGDYDRYSSLPGWARRTLAAHGRDPRPHLYSLDQLEGARTHDRLWNAAQGQLVTEGRIHNYLRMLWGKKILEWSPSPEDALDVMIELNNKHALDGRDPNSYSGIFWVLGRYDRPWGPERPVFGKVRYMTSENTARKLSVRGYVARYGSGAGPRSA